MIEKVFLATNNNGKIERYKNLLKHLAPSVKAYTHGDLKIDPINVVEDGKTLEENAINYSHQTSFR